MWLFTPSPPFVVDFVQSLGQYLGYLGWFDIYLAGICGRNWASRPLILLPFSLGSLFFFKPSWKYCKLNVFSHCMDKETEVPTAETNRSSHTFVNKFGNRNLHPKYNSKVQIPFYIYTSLLRPLTWFFWCYFPLTNWAWAYWACNGQSSIFPRQVAAICIVTGMQIGKINSDDQEYLLAFWQVKQLLALIHM